MAVNNLTVQLAILRARVAALERVCEAAGELLAISQALSYNFHWKEETCSQCHQPFVDGHANDCYFIKLEQAYQAATAAALYPTPDAGGDAREREA